MPGNRRLYTEVIKATERVKIQDVDDRTIYSFELNDPDPHRTFSNIPDGIATQGSLQVSTESSWSDIADWAVGVYDIDLSLPKSALSKIKSIRRAHKADGDRAMAALQWVQDHFGEHLDGRSFRSNIARSHTFRSRDCHGRN